MTVLEQASNLTNTAFSHLPIIDLANIDSEDPAERAALAQAVRDACMNVGFFYIKNHGIPEHVLYTAYAASQEFFALPDTAKAALDITSNPGFKGYNGVRASNNDPSGAGDMHEGFEFGWEELVPRARDEKRAHDGPMAGANVWPQELPTFRTDVLTYYHHAVNLGKKLFPLFAMALDLPPHFFDDKTRNSAAIMRVLHYPPQTGPVDDRVIGIGAHTDWECFTILWQEPGIQALQVLNAKQQWVNAPPVPGTFVVNIADQLSRWTNGVFKSTVHRAINRSGAERYSIPLFFGTDYDVRLEPIPTCVSPARPPQYEVVTAGEYVKARLQATYGH
ncbi:Clavaminate synthase-like protein [Phanerochaete sordida]|uniref:Clavaminate synthase-like protein n=1 Tax=Phanerochaete sordida TaxID=48140 RepID=A0A9P3GD88_9APHY|nr:Clavaminate synthase-like protein [Phanerochaete sordida]